MDLLPGIWCIIDKKSRLVYYNKAYATFLGISDLPEDYLIGKTRDEIPVNISIITERFRISNQLVLQSKKMVRTLHCISNADQTWTILQVDKSPIFNQNNEIDGIIIQYIDQTLNHSLDLALTLSRNYGNKEIMSSTDESIIFLNSFKKNVDLKPKESECLFYLTRGLCYKEIATKQNITYRTVVDHVHRLQHKFNASTLNDLVSKAIVSGYPRYIPGKIFSEPMAIILANKADSQTNQINSQDLIQDITFLKYKFEQTLNILPGAWWAVDKKSRFIYYNKYFEQMAGMEKMPKGFLIGKTAADIPSFASKQAPIVWHTDNKIIETKKRLSMLYCLLGARNEWIIFKLYKTPIFNSAGEVEAILSQHVDQTDNNALDLFLALANRHEIAKEIPQNGEIIFNFNKKTDHIDTKPREFECLFYLTRGYSYKEISKKLNIAYRTVSYIIESLKFKFNTITVTDLISKALASGYINTVPPNLFSKQMAIILDD